MTQKDKAIRKEINEILARDMPGWSVAIDAVLPTDAHKEAYLVKVVSTSGLVTKVVVVSQGRIHGAQG